MSSVVVVIIFFYPNTFIYIFSLLNYFKQRISKPKQQMIKQTKLEVVLVVK